MSTPRPLEGRVGIVTGGGKGLGRAFARHLAAAGAAVVVNNRNRTVDDDGRGPADHVVDEIAAEGVRRGVLTNVLLPYATTQMTQAMPEPWREALQPDLVAPVVTALVDPASSVNGQVVVTTGGGLRAADAVEYATVELGDAPLGPDRLAGLLALSRGGAARTYPDAMSAFSDLASDVTRRRS